MGLVKYSDTKKVFRNQLKFTLHNAAGLIQSFTENQKYVRKRAEKGKDKMIWFLLYVTITGDLLFLIKNSSTCTW